MGIAGALCFWHHTVSKDIVGKLITIFHILDPSIKDSLSHTNTHWDVCVCVCICMSRPKVTGVSTLVILYYIFFL